MIKTILVATDPYGKRVLTTPCKRANIHHASKTIENLIDTADYYNMLERKNNTDEYCCGLAANQIGENVSIFIYRKHNTWKYMINPLIVYWSKDTIHHKEGCMSMARSKVIERHKVIEVMYQTLDSTIMRKERFTGLTALIIQHEYDHLKGKLI